MIAATGLRWILTLAFAALAVHGTWRAVRAPRWPYRVSHLLHAVMAVAMAVMAWPRGMELTAGPQTAFFAAAALWYPLAALAWPGDAGRARELRGALPHAAAMAAMAWMLDAMARAMDGMSPASHTGGGGGGHAGGHHHGGGADSLATMSLTAPGARAAAGLLAVLFLAWALWWLARGFDEARAAPVGTPYGRTPAPRTAPSRTSVPHRAYDLLCHGAMALGMAVMFVLMV
ncbi:DUF5134 domain-containing protein [Streptomyces albiaxialis]|uniref:DUF5134 domain-containing protein n=1 Tax=Streptomyces albiaxialis TaxID=329523 RepID=A0ABP5HVI7_9ACTN